MFFVIYLCFIIKNLLSALNSVVSNKLTEVTNLKGKQETIQMEIPKPLDQLSPSELERKACIGKIMTYTLKSLTSTFVDQGFQWLLPVALSQCTDPLWPDPGASIEKRIEVDIYGKPVRATASMIIHKLVAASTAYPKLFILSPNIRIEKAERLELKPTTQPVTIDVLDAKGINIFHLTRSPTHATMATIDLPLSKSQPGHLENKRPPRKANNQLDAARRRIRPAQI